MIHFLEVMSSVLSLPPQLSNGNLNKGNVVVEPLGEGHNVPMVEGLGVVDGGGKDDPEGVVHRS